jgi:hypothetical protein
MRRCCAETKEVYMEVMTVPETSANVQQPAASANTLAKAKAKERNELKRPAAGQSKDKKRKTDVTVSTVPQERSLKDAGEAAASQAAGAAEAITILSDDDDDFI